MAQGRPPIALLAVALWAGSSAAHAFEVDQFTRRDVRPARDAAEFLDERVNQELDAAIADANSRLLRQGGRCLPGDPDSDERIGAALAARLVGRNPVKSRAEAWLMGLPEGEFLVSTPSVDSIYNSPRYQLVVIGNMLAPEIELAGVRTGTDKVGHFLQIGHRLHRLKVARAGLELPCAELERVTSEEGYYGCGSGGFVYSYGDMAANVAGQAFWDRLYGAAGSASYVICGATGRFERNPAVRPFTFADYVSPLWDEAVNCSMNCDSRGGHRREYGQTVQEVSGRFSCPYPEARLVWNGRLLSAPEYCGELASGAQEGDRTTLAEELWGSSCVTEVVSPACLRTGESPDHFKLLLDINPGAGRLFSTELQPGFAVFDSSEGAR